MTRRERRAAKVKQANEYNDKLARQEAWARKHRRKARK